MPLKRQKPISKQKQPKLVVAIGASASSLRELRDLLVQLDSLRDQVAFLVVAHLDLSGQKVDALGSFSSLAVREVETGTRIEAGNLYWVPPHSLVQIKNSVIKLGSAQSGEQRLAVIDHLFSSVGKEYGQNSIGIVLSGEGSDGALGVKSINESGGLTIVQSPESSERKTMPDAAIATGVVDHVVAPEKMTEILEKDLAYLSRVECLPDRENLKKQVASGLTAICDILLKRTRQDFKHYKASTLLRRIQRRMQVLRIDTVERYIERLSQDQEEAEALFRELLINVTSFFRDRDAFEALQSDVLEKLVKNRKMNEKIRIWVPGCSTGEESYSIAMLLSEITEKLKNKPEIQILSTDIDPQALNTARRGSYPATIAEQVPQVYLAKYFTRRAGRFHVNKELREMVLFSIHNLINDPPFSQLDLISCRNLIIYLGPHLQKKLFPIFHYALNSNGYLFLGTSESLTSHRELFKPVNSKHRIAQRKATAIKVPSSGYPNSIQTYLQQMQDSPKDIQADIALIGQKIALDEIPLKYAIVNEEGHLLSASEGIGKYIEIPSGPFQNHLVKLAKSNLRPALRKAFAVAKEEKRKVVDESSILKTETAVERVGVVVQPMPQLGQDSDLYWVAFQYLGVVSNKAESVASRELTAADQELIDQLEREVFVLREELDRSVQDLEASNEELKSSNEELLSMNEELQAANEELETSKEEVQMANEALQRVNVDLENLLAGTQIATLFLDDDLKIRGFTPAITEIYRIQQSDVGRDIRDFTSRAFRMDPFPDPKKVSSGSPIESEAVMPDGTIYQRRILPYLGYNSMREGIVVTFVDVTKLRQAKMEYKELADSMPNIVWTTTAEGATDYLNERWYEFTGLECGAGEEEASWLPFLHPEDRQKCLDGHAEGLKKGTPFEMEYRLLDRKTETYRWFLGRVVPVKDSDGKIKKWIGSAADIHDRVVAEEKRREADKLFQLMADNAPVIIWIAGADKRRTWFNKGWFDITGQSMAEALNEGWRQCLHPEDLERYVNLYNEHVKSKTPFYIEYRLRHRSGEYRWIGARGVPRVAADGSFEGFIGACLEIHEQKLAREVLAESRRSMELMIRTSPSFMAVLQGPNYVFESVNEQYLKLMGYREVVGKPVAEAVPESRGQGFIELLDEVRLTGEPFVGKEVPIMIQTTRAGPLQKRYLDFVYQPHQKVDGQVEKIFVHGVDVTEKVLSRAMIENERENFRNLFKQTPEMVCILSGSEHRFEFVNEAHVRVLGFDATGKTVREAQPESVEVHGILDQVYETGKTAELHEIPVTVTDRLRYFNLTYAARRDEEGRINGVMILGTEVTNEVLNRMELQTAKRDAENANKAKTLFLANMSHEIRTPLAAIVGFSELMQESYSQDPEASGYLERINRNASLLRRIIDDLLDLSKIEADKLEVERSQTDVDSLLEDVYSTIHLRAEHKGLELKFIWLTSKPKSIVTDPLRLAQILTNVIGNAVKFTDRGEVKVEISASETEMKFRISDTGIGMTPDQQSRIFQAFTQGDSSVTRKFGGTGLGLALSKRLAGHLGGDLRLIESVEGVGSAFELTIQTQGAGLLENGGQRKRSRSERVHEPLHGKRILVVDDTVDNRLLVTRYLKDHDLDVTEAANGLEAIEIALNQEFDVVLMDIQMPKMDGYQAMAELLKNDFKVPVIALTAHALKAERDRSFNAGFKAYIPKPIDRNHLVKTIRDVLLDARRS